MASQNDVNLKRKSDEHTDTVTDLKSKKNKKSQNNNSYEPKTEDEQDGMNIDGTQEYEIADSDGFEFECEEIQLAETQEYSPDVIQNGGNNDGITLQRESTEENSQGFDAQSTEKDESVENKRSELDDKSASSSSCTDDDKCSMKKLESVQRDAQLISSVIPSLDVNTIYDKVLEKRKEKNRVDIITNEIIENGMLERDNPNGSISGIYEETAEVLFKYPNADAGKVHDMLEKLEGNPNRLFLVLDQLAADSIGKDSSNSSMNSTSLSTTSSNKSTDILSDPAFKTNPLYKDLKTLRKVLPNINPNEIYAFLEAHFDKPNRVQIVIDELTKSDSQESLPVAALESFEDLDKGKAPLTLEDKLQADVKELQEIFTDCDPNYLYEKLDKLSNEHQWRVGVVASELFENKNYPRLSKTVDQVNKETQLKSKMKQLKFDLKDFLAKFPDPVGFFDDTDRQVNQNYKAHAVVYLKNTYPYLKDGYIKKVLENHKHHLAPAVEEVEEELEQIMERLSKKKRVTPREVTLEYPDDLEELFFQEVMFCQHRQNVKDHLAEQKHVRDTKIEAARRTGELIECGCCFDDECLFEEMDACADGHIFCKECIERSCVAAVGDGKTKFLCLTGTCEQQFPLKVLQEILPATIFSLALRKIQEEELRQADIPDLVACPFCSFATIMPDEDDKVLKCLNPDCLKESCRLCKEPNHVPLRCSEIEKQGETNMRAFIETKMSEAMLRECPSCKKRFYKESGCNKMTCTCGASMCYVCREPNINYGHFDQGKCSIDSDIFTLHKDEMLEAAEKARQEYLKDHPDADQELKYDPVKLLEKMKMRWDGDEDDNEDNDDEEDYDE